MRKGLTRICLVGIALSALLASGCVTGGSSDDNEVFNSGGNGSTTTVYDIANGDLASGGVVIGDGGGPRSPGPGSGVPQPFGPTGGTTGSVTTGTSSGGTGTTGTGGTSGGATTGTTGTGGTSGGSPPGSFTNFLYIPNDGGAGALSILGATSTGTLSFINAAFATAGRATNLGVRPNGQTIYYPVNDLNQIQAYSVNQTTGNLTALGAPVTTGTGSLPERVMVSPNGSFAYVANSGNSTISQYTVATDGQLVPLTPASVTLHTPSTFFSTIGIEPNSQHVYALASSADMIDIYQMPAGDGVLAYSGTSVATPDLPGQIVFTRGANPTGFAYVSSFTSGQIRAYARNGGDITPLTPTADFNAGGFGTNDLLIHPSLNVLYALNTSSGATSLAFFTINPTSGALSAPTVINVTDPTGMAITQNGSFLFVWKDDNTIDTYALNAATGAPTLQQTFTTPGLNLPNDGVGVPPVLQRRVDTP